MNQKNIFENHTFKFILLIAFFVICFLLGRIFKFDIEQFRAILLQYPFFLSGILYVILYVTLTLLIWLGPKDIFRILGAVLFGPYVSTVLVWAAEMCNAAILFNLSRKLGREFVEDRFKLKTKDLDKTKGDIGVWGILALRVNPLVPFRFLDLSYGLTAVSSRKYFTVALLGSPLRILWLQIVLAAIGTTILKHPNYMISSLMNYMFSNPFNFFFSAGYLLFVFIFGGIVALIKLIKLKR